MSSSEKAWSGQGEQQGEPSSGSAGWSGDASPSDQPASPSNESAWNSGKWTEAEMKEWWAKKSKAK